MRWRARWRKVIVRLAARSRREQWPLATNLGVDLRALALGGPRTARYIWRRERRTPDHV